MILRILFHILIIYFNFNYNKDRKIFPITKKKKKALLIFKFVIIPLLPYACVFIATYYKESPYSSLLHYHEIKTFQEFFFSFHGFIQGLTL